jgi:sugar phosphate isomerase/epimerase
MGRGADAGEGTLGQPRGAGRDALLADASAPWSQPLTVGACTYGWLWDAPLDEAVRRIARLGCRYFELMTTAPHCWPRGWSAADRQRFRRLYEACGLRMSSVNPTFLDLNLASPNPGFREETVRQLRETLELAHDIGAPMMLVTAGKKHPLIAPDDRWLWEVVRQGLETLLPDCRRLGVVLGLENGWTVIDRAEQMVRMAREVDDPWLGLVYDVANAWMVEPVVEGLERVREDLVMVQLSDTDPPRWGHDRIGSGAVDFAAVTAKVRAMGFCGPTIMEIVDRRAAEESNRVSLERLRALGWTA